MNIEMLEKLNEYAGELSSAKFDRAVYSELCFFLMNQVEESRLLLYRTEERFRAIFFALQPENVTLIECGEVMLEDLCNLPLMIGKYTDNHTAQCILEWRIRNKI